LERNHVNDHGRVQIRHEHREINVRKVVRGDNTNVDKFVIDNMDMSDVHFEDVFVKHGEHFGQQQNCEFIGEIYGDNFGPRRNYRYQDHKNELDGDLDTIKLKIPAFQGKNDPQVYLELKKKVELIF
jgi:hypothetical protein